jgi:uncharacterized protein (TIGR03790 family)
MNVRMLYFAALAGVLSGEPCARAISPNQVVVLANTNVPGSLDVARHYMKARGIPAAHLVTMDLPARESISRYVYETRLRDPLLVFLRDRNLAEQVTRDEASVQDHESPWRTVRSSVRCLVSVYGMPLRIVDTRFAPIAKLANWVDGVNLRDSAAVDSELALLLHDPYDIQGSVRNPLYAAMHLEDLGDNAHAVLVACRLDGPDPETARRLVDDAIWSEKHGLAGRGYFDALGTLDRGYAQGDHWVIEACERFRREGFECTLDLVNPVWGPAYPLEQVAVYMGWYNEHAVGPFLRPDFAFARGAIAYHLHSSSAKTLRSTTLHWAGPLLARGAAVTMGAVDEPYLGLTIDLDRFADRLCSGATVGESWYLALPALSWQMTLIGDPLYRPFGRPLDALVSDPAQDHHAAREWAWLRRMNVLVREGRLEGALAYGRQKIEGQDSLLLREKLADLYALNGRFDEAFEQYGQVVEQAQTAETAVRAGARYLLLLRQRDQAAKARVVEESLLARWADSPCIALLGGAHP